MQFASPDWQPGSSRPGHSPDELSFSSSVQVKDAPDAGKLSDLSDNVDTSPGDQASAYSNNSQDYQAAPPDEQPITPGWAPEQTRTWTPQSADKASSREAGRRQRHHQKQRPASVRTRSRKGGQLLALFVRVALLVIWFTTPLVTRAFHGGWIMPLLGMIFFPLTTLTYTIVFALAGSVTGSAWLWVVGALLLDLVSYGGQASKRRSDPPQDVD